MRASVLPVDPRGWMGRAAVAVGHASLWRSCLYQGVTVIKHPKELIKLWRREANRIYKRNGGRRKTLGESRIAAIVYEVCAEELEMCLKAEKK